MSGPFKFDFFTKNSIPDWPCPACARATLELIPESFNARRTARAINEHAKREDFGPDDDEMVFSCQLRCNQKNCLQPVAVSGDGYYEQDWSQTTSSYDLIYEPVYRPRYFYPPLNLFTRCEAYPEQINIQLRELSAQLPGHPQAAINALRTTLEIVLDSFKIPRTANGRYLSLDRRISCIPEPFKYVEAGFRAMKWLGNTGSHNLRPVSSEDIEGACIMLDDFLLRIYRPQIDHSVTIARLIKNHDPSERDKT
ncbi:MULTISPECIES: DUF4145 domain-containing protein [Citrobacter]|uniref:DUF4145 domain-containing protein n=1 Tax=Citrobacter TaxID=544 RepID=UPI0015E953A6|nr:DUF4145 domain-containing protein [Citrobacter sp. RHBSTW-01044]QLR13513.1 DUF4145 domain-containing protein [Citrobacter sp. RHBSTW-01044]